MMGKHVSLSTKSLRKVSCWCSENEGSPLAELYYGACSAVGMFDLYGVREQLNELGQVHRLAMLRELEGDAFRYRDSIGRIILGVIKKQGKKEG